MDTCWLWTAAGWLGDLEVGSARSAPFRRHLGGDVRLGAKLAATEGRQHDVIGVGECMVELLADEPLGLAEHLRRGYGGDVLNTLVTARRLGRNASFISKVGNDPFGPPMRHAWEDEGIDLTWCPLVDGENGVYFISLQADGEREFTYRRAGSAASTLSPADVDADHLASARIVLLSGITQAISPTAQAATLAAAHHAADAGCIVALDVNYRAALWRRGAGEAAAATALQAVLPFLDILIASVPADLSPLGEPVDATVRGILEQPRPSVVALKLGAAGSSIHTREGSVPVPSTPVANIVDTTGAGDAWNAGFFDALLRGLDPIRAAAEANVVGSRALGHRGALAPRPGRTPPSSD